MTLALENPWVAILAIVVGLFGVARLTRVVVYDDFPPAVWWRNTWSAWTHDGPWAKLFTCWWCLSSWVAAVCIVWFLLTDLHPVIMYAWWIVWGALALGYAAAMVIVRDSPADSDSE